MAKQFNADDRSQKFNKNDKSKCSKGRKSSKSPRSYKNGGKQDTNSASSKSYTDGDVNDPSYYYEEPTVLQQVMNFSFNEFGGVPLTIARGQAGQYIQSHNTMVASYWLNPSIPQTSETDAFKMDGVTTASLRNYLALSGSNNKSTIYAPQDVTLLTLAVAELIKTSTWIARAFGVAYLFNYRNRSYPETLLWAMGINPHEFGKNLAAYRVRYNKLLAMASKIPFPADIPIFRKAADLYGYIYLDDPNSALAQTYMLNPYSVWMFDEAYDENGAGLVTTSWVNALSTDPFSDVLDRFEAMISALINSTSLNAIYSDIMRLVQNGKITNLITFKPIDEMFVVAPVYNEEVRDWLHNAMIIGNPLPTAGQFYDPDTMEPLTDKNDVSCDASTNKVKYHPQFYIGDKVWGYSGIIDFTHDNPTVEEKVRATRFTQRWTFAADPETNKAYTNDIALADEYIVRGEFWTGEGDTAEMYMDQNFMNYPSETARKIVQVTTVLSKFDWAPLFYMNDIDNGVSWIEGDLDYYTTLDYNTLKRIYDYEIIHLLQIG